MDDFKEYNGFRYQIKQDTDSDSPCTWDNYGLIAFKKKVDIRKESVNLIIPNEFTDYDVIINSEGDEEDVEVEYTIEEYLTKVYDAVIVIPVRLYDYGSNGYVVRECEMEDANGAVYTTKKQIEMITGTEYDLEKIREYMLEDLKVFNQWLEGDVWGYTIEEMDEEFVDSCWGFYGWSDCDDEARRVIDSHVAYMEKLPTYEVHAAVVFKVKAENREIAEQHVKEELGKFKYPGTIVDLGGKLFD